MTTENTPASVATPQNAPVTPKDPYKGYNIALYVGSAFIVIAAFFFATTASELFFAPTLLIITILLYLAGIGLYKSVDYLKPVAKAFSITGLVMTLFWPFAFQSLGMPHESAACLGATVFTLLSYATSLVINSSGLAYVSYLATFYAIITFAELFDIGSNTAYIVGILWMIVSFGIASLWYNRVTWLPVPFRRATRGLSRWTTPAICVIMSMIGLSSDNLPMLTTVVLAIALLQFAYGYMLDHSANKLLAIRFMTQATLVALAHDVMTVADAPNKTMEFGMGLVLFISSAMQLAYSLFVDRPKNAIASNENLLTIIAVIGLLLSTTFFGSLTMAQQSVVRIIAYAVISGFGVGLTYKHHRAGWMLLPYLGLMLLPFEFGTFIFEPKWNSWIFMGAYTIVSVIITLIYAGIRNFKDQEREAFTVSFSSTLFALFIVVGICFSEQCAELGWLIATIITVAQAYISNRKDMMEFPIYTGALCLYCVSNQIFGNIIGKHVVFGPTGHQLDLIRSVFGVHILALAPAIASFWKERSVKSTPRAVIAFFFLSLIVLSDAWIFRIAYNSIGLALFFLVEQVLFMILGILWKRNWLTNSAIVFSFLVVFYMSTGYGYLWLFVIGLALITGVVMSLTKAHNKQQSPEAPQTVTPAPTTPAIEPAPTAHVVAETVTPAAEPATTTAKEPAGNKPETENGSSRLGKKPHSAKYN